jgi:hypothetical protein
MIEGKISSLQDDARKKNRVAAQDAGFVGLLEPAEHKNRYEVQRKSLQHRE